MTPYKPSIRQTISRMEPLYRREMEALLATLPDSLDDFLAVAVALANEITLGSSQGTLKSQICWLLGRIQTRQSLAVLLRFTENDDSRVAAEAIRTLASSTLPFDIAPFIVRFHASWNDEIKSAIVYALSYVGRNPIAIDFLVEVLDDTSHSSTIRGLAAEGLGQIGTPAVVPTLLEHLTSPFSEVRYWVVFALGQLGDVRAIPALERVRDSDGTFLHNYNTTVSAEAIAALESIRERPRRR